MKIVAACEDTGSLKVVIAEHGTDTSKPADESNPVARVQISSHATNHNRKSKVTHLIQSPATQNVIVSRLDGSVEIYDTSKVLKEEEGKERKLENQEESGDTLPLIHHHSQVIQPFTYPDSEIFIDVLVDDNGRILAPTNKGNVFIWTSEKKLSEEPYVCKLPLDKDESVEAFKIHPGKKHADYVAYGGKETDLRIVKLPSLKKKGEAKIVFKSKNVSNSRLELRVPIYIKSILFDKESTPEAFKLYTFTAVGDMRYYDSSAGRKPRSSILVLPKKAAITNATWMGDKLIVCDNRGIVVKVDPSTGSQICQFKGQIGSTQALYNFNNSILGTTGFDRYVRAYNNETRDCIVKVFIGTQSNALAIIEDTESLKRHKANIIGDTALEAIKKKEAWEEKKLQQLEEEESDEEELWSKLESNITQRRKRRKLTLA